jgi:ATP-grasp domain
VVTSPARARECFAGFAPSAVLKLDLTYGGDGVGIAHSAAEAAAAFRRMRRAGRLDTALKRAWINHDPLALSSWSRRGRAAVTMQRFIAGTPANIMVACWQGQVLADACVHVLSSQGPTGAALVVQLIDNAECRRAARALAAHCGMSGFFGLDFILEEGSGAAWLIEMNPRCTQLGHLPLAQGDLAGTLCAALRGQAPAAVRAAIASDLIAFFPQARLWGVSSALLQRAYHDVPSDQEALVEMLLQRPWPERQWLARAYHRLRRPAPTQALDLGSARGGE